MFIFLEKVLSLETIDLFKDWGLLCARVLSDLELMNLSLTSKEIQSRVQQLCDSICSFQIGTDSNKIHIFGSRAYGLATDTTDIDIYMEIGKQINLQLLLVDLKVYFFFFDFFVFIKNKHKVKINVHIGESFYLIEI